MSFFAGCPARSKENSPELLRDLAREHEAVSTLEAEVVLVMKHAFWIAVLFAAVSVTSSGRVARAQDQVRPFTIVKPVEGQVVRETVKIEVLRGDLPPGGFAALSVDGRGIIAKAVDDDAKAIVFFWNSKEDLPPLSTVEKGLPVEDGHHTIAVTGYNSAGKSVEESSVGVVLENQVQKDFPEGVFLGYRFRIGDTVGYSEDTVAKFREATGSQKWPLLELGKLSWDRKWDQTIADVVTPNSAVLWRKFSKEGRAIGFGEMALLPEDNRVSYIFIDSNGWTEPTARSKSIGETGLWDWVTLPVRRVKLGETWRSKVRIVLDPYDVRPVEDARAESKLVGFEWESGRECAKVVTTVEWKTGGAIMGLPPNEDAQIDVHSFSGTITTYIALANNRLVKTVEDLEIQGDFLGSLGAPTQPGAGGGTQAQAPGIPGTTGGSEFVPLFDPGRRGLLGASGGGGGGSEASGGQPSVAGGGTPPLGPGSATPPTGGGLQSRRQPGRSGTAETAERTKVKVERTAVTVVRSP